MAHKTTHELSPGIIKHAKLAFGEDKSKDASFDTFLKDLTNPEHSAALPVANDTSHPLSHYFISTSHNTYLSGNQLWGKSSGDAYKDVLKKGCRCIEIDLWDGDSPSSSEAESDRKSDDNDSGTLAGKLKSKLGRLRSRSNLNEDSTDPSTPAADDQMPTPWRTNSGRSEPTVYHGYTATTELPFRKVCEVVRDYAFKHIDLPLIVSLEVHCSPAQQEIVVELMNDYWGNFLQRVPEYFSDETLLPSLESLRNKILVKVKYSPPEKAKASKNAKGSPRSSMDHDSQGEDDAVKKGKILRSLSSMGVFTRAFHFDNFNQPEASIPTHVFSLSETKLIGVCEEQPQVIFAHNLKHLMRAYPKGARLSSSNLDPAPFWRFGVQMVALNFQKMNAAMMLNTAQFEGTGGWTLKPPGYLPTPGKQLRANRMTLDLSIKIIAAQELGPKDDAPNAFVKCQLHVESKAEHEQHQIPRDGKSKGGEHKLRSAVRHSRDPDFGGEILNFQGVQHVCPALSFLRIKVMDDSSYQKDRLLGWMCWRLDRLPQDLMLVNLRGGDSKLTGGKLLVEIRSNATKSG